MRSRDFNIGCSIIHGKNFELCRGVANEVSLDAAGGAGQYEVRNDTAGVKG